MYIYIYYCTPSSVFYVLSKCDNVYIHIYICIGIYIERDYMWYTYRI